MALMAFLGMANAAENAAGADAKISWIILFIGVTIGVLLTLMVLSLRRIRDHGRALKGGEDFRDVADFAGDWVWEMDSKLQFRYLSARFF